MEEQSSVIRQQMKYAIPVEKATSSSSPLSARDLKENYGLQEDQVSFKIPTNEDAAVHVHHKHGNHSWQAKILKFIHTKWFQRLLLGLLLLDILILFTELFLMSMFPACYIIVRDALSCCALSSGEPEARWLASESHSDICEPPLEVAEENPAGCDPHKWYKVHTLENVLFAITVSILSIMMLELLLLMAAISPCTFFRHFWYVLDFLIVAISLGLEASFKAVDDDQLATYVGALIIFRSWRFVRISHGLIEMTAEITSEKYHKVVKKAMELENLLAEHDRKMVVEGREDCDTDSVVEIRLKSKDLADAVVATEAEDRDEMNLSELTKKVTGAVHLSLHKSHHVQQEQANDGNADADSPVNDDNEES